MVQGSKVQRSGFKGSRVLGSKVQGSKVLGSKVQGSTFWVINTETGTPLILASGET